MGSLFAKQSVKSQLRTRPPQKGQSRLYDLAEAVFWNNLRKSNCNPALGSMNLQSGIDLANEFLFGLFVELDILSVGRSHLSSIFAVLLYTILL